MQLQLSLTLADDLYDLLVMSGEPVDFMQAAGLLLSLTEAPEPLCRRVMDTLVTEDRRFAWSSPNTIGLCDWRFTDPDLAEVSFVVIDLETTGTRPGASKITEIGAVRIEGLEQVATFETLVNPQRPIPQVIIELTGITPQMLLGAPRIEEVMPHLLDFIDGAVVVAHNSSFDLGFLNYELARLRGRRLGDGAIDTVPLSRCAAPGLPNHKLGTVAEALGSPVAANHRALADALATAHVFLTCVGRLQERGVTRLDELRTHIDPGHRRDRHKLALTRDIPRAPGAYLFLDEDGNVLYVGKANQLRDRVRSYFLSNVDHSRKVRQAVRRLRKVEWETTGSPLRAVVREQELILTHRPTCNVFGRRPENYCYVKLGGRGSGLRLYSSDRPGNPAKTRARKNHKASAPTRPAGQVIGPFRGRSRVTAALELLHRTFPVRQCRGTSQNGPCIFGQTERCLAPCSEDGLTLPVHDQLAADLLDWLGGGAAPALGDPLERARRHMERLAAQRRYEEAQEVRDALDGLITLRGSYAALREAHKMRVAVLWLDGDAGEGPRLHVDLVWHGLPDSSATVSGSTAAVEIGRMVRSLPTDTTDRDESDGGSGRDSGGLDHVAVPQDRLDLLLAVRRWVIDAPTSSLVWYPGDSAPAPQGAPEQGAPECHGLDLRDETARREAWRQEILTASLTLLRERPVMQERPLPDTTKGRSPVS